jgi:N-acetyl-anhydromuramyl-L-alanine amidase AmpD
MLYACYVFRRNGLWPFLVAIVSIVCSGCLTHPQGQLEKRKGDEIVVAGQFFHTGTHVVLWMDPGGYDAYRVERRFGPYDQSDWQSTEPHIDRPKTPNRYSIRDANLTTNEIERIRGGGWDLPTLQSNVDQFVLHFDVAGISRTCFKVLQDNRDLSVHFMLDLDGTIYQTLDLKERARHATISNNRSIGIEIANMGAYRDSEKSPLDKWYGKDAKGRTVITIPEAAGPNPLRTPHFKGRPVRREPVVGQIQGETLSQYDFTRQQYKALAKLTATLCTVFPKITCDYPREADGRLMTHKLPNDELRQYEGVLGHYHIQTNKVDPGPALQWDYIIGEARHLMKQMPARTTTGQTVMNRTKLIKDN